MRRKQTGQIFSCAVAELDFHTGRLWVLELPRKIQLWCCTWRVYGFLTYRVASFPKLVSMNVMLRSIIPVFYRNFGLINLNGAVFFF